MYRIHVKDKKSHKANEKKWSLIAAFVYLDDANAYLSSKIDNKKDWQPDLAYKIMQGNRNIRTFNV